jgi:hypothetical protein
LTPEESANVERAAGRERDRVLAASVLLMLVSLMCFWLLKAPAR